MKDSNFDKVINLLEKSGCDIDFRYHLKNEDFTTADDVRTILDDAGAFDQEIIYYSTAMKYLTEHDTSLNRSLQIAHDLGYELKNLNSETLASLLSSEITREEFEEVCSGLDELLTEIAEEEENETTEETN